MQPLPSVYQPKLIANPRTGLERDVIPFLLPDDAYPVLENCYLWRGRIQKKGGTQLLGRLGFRTNRTAFVRTANPDPFIIVLPAFERGTATLTDGVTTFQDDGAGVFAVIAGSGIAGTVDYATFTVTGTFTGAVPGAPNTYASWQAVVDTNSPAMGLRYQETASIRIGNLIGFDLLYAYRFDDVNNRFNQLWNYATPLATSDLVTWSGTNSDFFYSCNWADAFWVTNGVVGDRANPITNANSGDGIRFFSDNNTNGVAGWVNFRPQVDGTNFLQGCKFLLPFKDTLIAFSTSEGTTTANSIVRTNRVRWSQQGTPFYVLPTPVNQPVDVNAWRDDIPGKGDFSDIPTTQAITGVQFLNDDIIIFCERSKYRLTYTGNKSKLFLIQKIDIDFGCESPFSIVPLDNQVLSVAYNGITISDGVQTIRIDEKIPDQVFEFHNSSSGNLRVHGIRDYYAQLIYWTYTDDDENSVFPNRTLTYNYLDGNWSVFITQYTCFGYYHRISDLTWGAATSAFSTYDVSYGNPSAQADFPLVVGGNQNGYVNYIDNQLSAISILNDTSLRINNISAATPAVFTVINHGLLEGQWIQITGVNGVTNINSTTQAWQVLKVLTADTFTLQSFDESADPQFQAFVATGTYTYGGNIALIDDLNIQTKRFAFFLEQGLKARLGYIDILLDSKTTDALMSIDFFSDEFYGLPLVTSLVNAFVESDPLPDRIWRRVYFNSEGQFFALRFRLSNAQLSDISNASQQQIIYALNLWVKPAGRWLT